MPDFGSEGQKAALVTGASRGIGRVIAMRLAGTGRPVAVNYRVAAGEATDVVRRILECGGTAVALQADVSDPHAASTLVARAEAEIGPLEVLVNNAGMTRDRLLIQMSEADWDAAWTANLAGARALVRTAATAMAGRGGRILNIGSVVGVPGSAGQANYAAAKSALLGITREFAVSFARDEVTVNAVLPGYVETDATAHLTPEQKAQWLRRIPMGRYARPEEIADIVVFLAGRGAGYITGQCIAVDGGFLAAAGAALAS